MDIYDLFEQIIQNSIHYKDFDTCFCWNDKTDCPKRWLICPIDGLRYYY